MTTHTVPFYFATGQTLTAKIFTSADVLEDEASSVTESTNRKQRYVATFEDVAAGDYTMIYYVAGDAAGYELVRFTGVNGEVAILLPDRHAELDSAGLAQINAQVLDVLQTDTFAELAGPPAATSSLKDKLTWLFMWARNKATESATERKLFADDTTTVVSTESVGDSAGVFTKGEAI